MTNVDRREPSDVTPVSGPLGYVFWHWPRGRESIPLYEERLALFQRDLVLSKPRGLRVALSYRLDSLPWRPKTLLPCYEDWYITSGFGSLGVLNRAAVGKTSRRSHDAVARLARGGEGGLYAAIVNNLGLRRVTLATWFNKPSDQPYGTFLEDLRDRSGEVASNVWQRQMALGPAPEFCVQSTDDLKLPKEYGPVKIPVKAVGSNHSERKN